MKQAFLERHHFATFLILAALGVGLATASVNAPERVTPLQTLGLSMTTPIAKVGTGVADLGEEAWSGVSSLDEVHERLGAAMTENRDLHLRLQALQEMERENARLRRLLRLQDELSYEAVPARIIHRQMAPDRVLVIDRGSAHGLREDLAVVSPDGVVGKVLAVTRHSAKVQAVSDPDTGAAAAVLVGEARRQASAVVRDVIGDGLLRLRHLELLAEVYPGDRVLTSGLDLVYPKGWLLGTVEEVIAVPGFEPDVHVRPAVELDHLEEVLVLLPDQPRREAVKQAVELGGRP